MTRTLRSRLTVLAVLVAFVISACGDEPTGREGDSTATPDQTTEPTDDPTDIETDPGPDGFGAEPQGATADYGILITPDAFGSDTVAGATDIVIWTEPACGGCRAFFDEWGDDILGALSDGTITVEIRLATFLDRDSADAYSSRAAQTAVCTAELEGTATFFDVLLALYAAQPSGGDNPTDDDLLAVATSAGAAAAVGDCLEQGAYADWVSRSNDAFNASSVGGTPTVEIDGSPLSAPGDIGDHL